MEKAMEKITAQEALHRLAERYNEKIISGERKSLVGLDINDYASIFRRKSEVSIMEYYQEKDTLAGTLMSHKQEIIEEVEGASDVMLQVIAAKSHVLMIEDVNELAAFVGLLGENVNFYWGVEYEETSLFKVKIEVYIIK
ncbi:MAG: hypothetical protein SOV38_07955 [Prevotella sp.]|nr:hypothetical protein [Prevotella sp.]